MPKKSLQDRIAAASSELQRLDETTVRFNIEIARREWSKKNPDIEKIYSLLKEAIERPLNKLTADANFLMWDLLYFDLNDIELAKKHLIIAAELNHPRAMADLGRAYFGNWLVPENAELAFKYLSKAHDLGDKLGTEMLAFCYMDGIGVQQDVAQSTNLLISLGEGYSGDNCCELSERFRNGIGTPKDVDKAEHLLYKAMLMGSSRAYYVRAQQPNDGTKSLDEYYRDRFRWMKKSVNLKNPYQLSFNKLGQFYFFGQGTAQNFKLAKETFKKGIELGMLDGLVATAEMYLEALEDEDPISALDRILSEE